MEVRLETIQDIRMVSQISFGLEHSNVKGSYNQEDKVQGKYCTKNKDIGPLTQKGQK